MSNTLIKIKRALISVADKNNLEQLVGCLDDLNVEILSTGGTAKAIKKLNVNCTEVADITQMGEIMDGRLKTLHPTVLGGILHDRNKPKHAEQLEKINAKDIDLVVVNFYPFAKGLNDSKHVSDLVELIDIGGPTMVRSAAKNHERVCVVVDANDYELIINELTKNDGCISTEFANKLAAKAFSYTASYDAMIASAFTTVQTAKDVGNIVNSLTDLEKLTYGENPHQQGWSGIASNKSIQLAGKKLSYNNYQDAISAWRLVAEFEQPACAIIKHTNPCGVAIASDIKIAFTKALTADEVSAYGGVVALNCELNEETLSIIKQVFFEVLIIPMVSDNTKTQLANLKRIKVIKGPIGMEDFDVRSLGGFTLVQQRDVSTDENFDVVSKTPSDAKINSDLEFAWKVAKHTRSNAIVLVKDGATIGIGCGQTSRVEAAQLAISRAHAKGFDTQGCVAASDAFFPFADGVECLANAGISAVIQPGGSKRDDEVIAAADSAEMVMVTTNTRHFVH